MTDLIKRKRPAIDVRIERLILTGMIVSDRFLKEVQPMLQSGGSFQADSTKKVSSWCIDYWKRYGKAPREHIEDLYHHFGRQLPEDQANLIDEFLGGLTEEYERNEGQFNTDYVLDEAERYFRIAALKELKDDISAYISAGRIEEAEERTKAFKRPARPQARGVDPLRDIDTILEALKSEESNTDILMYLPGALGYACGPLERGMFMAIQAESGVGKTWWLGLIARLGVMQGLNVPFFSLEMKEKKMTRRIWQDLCAQPIRGNELIKIPVFDCVLNQNDECSSPKRNGTGRVADGKASSNYKPCAACRRDNDWDTERLTTWWREEERQLLDPAGAIRKQLIMDRTGMLKRAGRFHMKEFPQDGLSIDEMISYVNNLEYYDGFISDLIVSDYADKFRWPIPNDPRNSISKIWGGHKGLAQEKHCLVLSASQSNTERSGKKVGQGSWSETIEKRRVLDLGIAINQKPKDYDRGLAFMTIDKIRDGDKIVSAEVAVLQQLAIGRPYIDSCLVRRKRTEKGKK